MEERVGEQRSVFGRIVKWLRTTSKKSSTWKRSKRLAEESVRGDPVIEDSHPRDLRITKSCRTGTGRSGVQWARVPLVTLKSHTWMLVPVLGTLLPIQLFAHTPRKTMQDAPSAGAPATLVGDQAEVPGSCLLPGSWSLESFWEWLQRVCVLLYLSNK